MPPENESRNKSQGVSQFATECNDQLEGDFVTNITQNGLRNRNYLEYENAIAAFLDMLRCAVSPSLRFCRTRNEFTVPEMYADCDEIDEG